MSVDTLHEEDTEDNEDDDDNNNNNNNNNRQQSALSLPWMIQFQHWSNRVSR
jgi:hypothetical protein